MGTNPYACGYAFVRDRDAHRACLSHRASYLIHAEDARDQIDWNPDWSRRARGFATYAAIREMGRAGITEMLERCCEVTRLIADGLAALPGVEVLCAPVVNQAMLAFGDDNHTEAVMARIVNGGEAFLTGTTFEGRRAIRVALASA